MRRTLALLAGLAMASAGADAQIIRQGERTRQPVAFATGTVGWFNMDGICDNGSQACWEFGSAAQYKAVLEVPYGSNGVSLGLSYATARVPMIWRDFNSSTSPVCGTCDADVTVNQLMGILHLGAGTASFQQLIDLSVGTTQFTNFKTTNGVAIGPAKAPTDFTFAVTYGFGFRISRQLYFTLQQDYGLVVHKRVPGTTRNSAEVQTTRAGLRFAFY